MRKKFDDATIRKIKSDRERFGTVSLRQVAIALSEIYGCSDKTIRRYLDEGAAERDRISQRESQRRKARKKRSDQHTRLLQNQFHRVQYNPAKYLPHAFIGRKTATIEDITESFSEQRGVNFRGKSIDGILAQYETGQSNGTIRGPPYLRLNPETERYTYGD